MTTVRFRFDFGIEYAVCGFAEGGIGTESYNVRFGSDSEPVPKRFQNRLDDIISFFFFQFFGYFSSIFIRKEKQKCKI